MSDRLDPLKLSDSTDVDDMVEIYATRVGAVMEIDNPWDGDTQTGFGRSASVTLRLENCRMLRDWLTKRLETIQSSEAAE